MIQDTSLFAYSVATQDLGAKQKEVLDALRFFPDATNAEIAAHLGWPGAPSFRSFIAGGWDSTNLDRPFSDLVVSSPGVPPLGPGKPQPFA